MARDIDIQTVIEEIQSSLDIPSYSEHDKGFDDGLKYVLDLIEKAPTLTQPNEPLTRGFDVIDTKTGEYPDLWDIALKEDWAKGLMYCDMEGFAIEEDGTLFLLDECGKFRYCPIGRFEVRRPPEGEEEP